MGSMFGLALGLKLALGLGRLESSVLLEIPPSRFILMRVRLAVRLYRQKVFGNFTVYLESVTKHYHRNLNLIMY